MSTTTSPGLRCPRCAAHVRAGSDWCTLCYTDLRPPPPEPEPAPPATVPPAAEMATPAGRSALPQNSAAGHYAAGEGTPAEAPAPRPRGKHARRAPAEPVVDPAHTAEAMLAQLAAEESKSPFGAYAGLLDTTGKKVGLMAGGAVLLTGLLFLVMAVLGSLL